MAMRRLISQFQALSQNGDVQGLRNNRIVMVGQSQADSEQVFFDQATMIQVSAMAGGTAFLRGKSVQARQSNDEPLTAGQVVFITKTRDGEYVIDGSVKG